MGEIGECEQASQTGGNMNSLRTGIKLAAGQQPRNSRGGALSARARNLAQTCWRHLLSALERPSDVPNVFWNILARKVHLGEYLALTGHRRWLKDLGIRTVVDVGAHTGEFASAISAILPTARIYSFEPQEDCHQRLCTRLASHRSFRAFCVALGDTKDEMRFYRSSFTKSSSLLPMSQLHKSAFPWSADNESMNVSVDRLDNYISELDISPPVLLKIDVQGYELAVLRGATKMLKLTKCVIVETSFKTLYHGQASFSQVYDMLSSAGFDYAGAMGQLTTPRDGVIVQADCLFVRRTL